YVIMGAPSGIDAILVYFKEVLSLSPKAIKNLRIKINNVLKLPIDKVTLQQFFTTIDKPCLVIHEISDSVTPIDPIKGAIENLPHIDRVYINGQDHMLKEQETIDIIQEFLKYKTIQNYVL
ncbi:MAG: hypothetical protein ACI9Y7_002713, partial [Dokdonia sp.]